MKQLLEKSMAPAWKLNSIVLASLCLLGVAVGLFGRLYAIGDRQLALDEYFFVRAISFISQEGIPQFPTGGYYVRGLIFQYVIAATVAVFGESGFALRLPVVIMSLASVVMAYLYGRKHVGHAGALAVAVSLLVSSWQIEFAQFIRMYAPFQFITLLLLYAVDDERILLRKHLRYFPHFILVLSVLTHRLGILLAPLLFLPLVSRRKEQLWSKRESIVYTTITFVVTIACYLWQKTSFRHWGVAGRFPDGFIPPEETAATFRSPEFLFWHVFEDPLSNLFFVFGIHLLITGVLWIWQTQDRRVRKTDILLANLLIASAAHSFVIAGILLTVLLFRYKIHRHDLHPQRSYLLLLLAVTICLGWLTYFAFAVVSDEFYGSILGSFRRTFFGWPDYYYPVLRPWLQDFPVITILTIAAFIGFAASKLDQPMGIILRHPAVMVGYIASCVGVFDSLHTSTRYMFFVYPVVLITIACAILGFVGSITPLKRRFGKGLPLLGAGVYAMAFMASYDFNPRHIMNINSDSVIYRLASFERFERAWYHREEYKSLANYVERVASQAVECQVIVESTIPQMSYYLDHDHVMFERRDRRGFSDSSREKGAIDMWTNKKLLSTSEELDKYTKDRRIVWILRKVNPDKQMIDIDSVWGSRVSQVSQVMLSIDKRLELMKIELGPPITPTWVFGGGAS